ncbi:hypothetical protein OUZ56_008167 [Daphnia magna]|uniref:Uncharacterized protein n=1 Tax=Daphnia magna TaxID=35525 RepID=A0ABR0AC59_9CRUS|nr:hypothetical protein OUZ56_008167 [Daphnia magna]
MSLIFNCVSSVSRETRKLAKCDPWRILETTTKLEQSTPPNPITFLRTRKTGREVGEKKKKNKQNKKKEEASSFERCPVFENLTSEGMQRDMTQLVCDNHIHK